ncbi:unnamed protein product [Phytophthora fragariaefolia]|uniref:Unnamed protein product n=1 Tax=Phytophthora fragariaefolia TaxID=1490495 RepID=A0A9W7CW18_9STRA|nr:unnamed protein product [Phytophthora fragariaefolia]
MSEQKNAKDPQPSEEQKTEDAVQHPLQNRWVLWYDNPKKRHSTESWEDNLKNVYTFNTVEDFWWYVRVADRVGPWLPSQPQLQDCVVGADASVDS